jgi:HTH-type transcriptional regulator/antitoxin HigA
MSGKKEITPETARGLSAALGTSAAFWMNLDATFRLSKTQYRDDDVRKRAAIYGYAPIRDMVRRTWLQASESVVDLEKCVKDFFEVPSLQDRPIFCGAAKETDAPPTMARVAWAFRVKQIARRVSIPKYSETSLRAAIIKMRSLMRVPSGVSEIPGILATCGVKFIIVEALPSGKIDGITFWLVGGETPVVGMSLRFDRIDNFWFVLRHELEHVLRGHGVDSPMWDIDISPSGDVTDERERLANDAASDFCVQKEKMDSWIARKSPFFSEIDLLGFAKTQNVHPGIVAGQLRHRIDRNNLFTKYLAKIRHELIPSAILDGWGQVYSTSDRSRDGDD